MTESDASLRELVRWFKEKAEGGVIIAFSGGVDSTLVAAAALQAVMDSAMAITVETDFVTKGEIMGAVAVAEKLGIAHKVLRLKFPQDMRANPPDRCYRCKRLILRELKDYAEKHGQPLVVDGTNFDDLHSNRPGIRALKEEGVFSPLAELGLSKREAREMSKLLGLDYSKPSSPCLATRFPTGYIITAKELGIVAKAEEYIRGMGFSQVRVRVRNGLAKIEVEREGLERMMEGGRYGNVALELKKLGFREVALDLEGYIPEPAGKPREKNGR